MRHVTKRFRWALSVIAILHHFSTPEVGALLKHCRKLIKDYCNAALEGEGYGASIITFEMFEYGFVFEYRHEVEEWVLEVVTFPDWDSPECRRKRPREQGAAERTIENLKALRRSPLAWLCEDLKEMLYRLRAAGPIFTKFWEDIGTGGSLHTVMEMLRNIRIPHSQPRPASAPLPLLNDFTEQQSHDYSDLVQLVRAKVNDAVGFVRLWTFPHRTAPRVSFDGLWDVGLFGALEQVSG